MRTGEPTRAPRILRLTVGLIIVLWLIATTGGRQILIQEVLGEAYDSQAEHLLRGDPGVDVEAIRSEAMIVDGKVRMYFGPFPALLRIPLNLLYPQGRGRWSRVSGFCAAVVGLLAFAGLLRETLPFAPLSARARNWLANACLLGFAFASPLLFLLGNLSIYNEAVLWGLSSSIAALYFFCRSRSAATAREVAKSLFCFSIFTTIALLSRVTFGAPLLLMAPLLAVRLLREHRLARLLLVFFPAALGLVFYLLLNYARFGSLLRMNYDYYVGPVHREFARAHGVFNLLRVPSSFADYFSLRFPPLQSTPPFFVGQRHYLAHPTLYSLPFSENYVSVLWCSGWLVLGAMIGILLLFQKRHGDAIDRCTAAILFIEFVGILAYFALAQRYSADLYPFLIFALAIFLRSGGNVWQRTAIVGLVAVSIVVNTLTTASWIAADGNLPPETRTFWARLAGKQHL